MAALAPTLARANTLQTITIPDRHGEIPGKWLNYYQGVPRANVLLPDGYSPRKHYPLLILLHGLTGNYDSYAHEGDMVVFNGFPGIVVMPEGSSGWYTDWWNNGQRGSPAWESYELNEVIPYILSHYPILPQRRYHAIAGISMGGLGAPYLGGRRPGFFGSVATLSGFDDLQYFAPVVAAAMGTTSDAGGHGDNDSDPVDGPPDGFYAAGHNPAQLTMNLKQTRVFESTGNGQPSSAELSQLNSGNASTFAGDWASEGQIIYPMNQLYHSALQAAGVNETYEVQNGGHDDPHFRVELKAMLAWGLFKPVVTNPTSWINDTVATSGQLWNVNYRFKQPPNQVVRFRRESASLSVGAAGSAVTLTFAGGCTIHTGTPAVIRIPEARGTLAGTMLGPVSLGMTRAHARSLFTSSSTRGRRYMDFFCLTPSGIRAGYASPKLLATLPADRRATLRDRVMLLLTANPFYKLRGIRPGALLKTAARRFSLTGPFHIGRNDWYLLPDGPSRGVLKVRHGLIEEIGIANRKLTSSRRQASQFLHSFG